MKTLRVGLLHLQDWRPRTYPESKIVMMEKLILRAMGKAALSGDEVFDAVMDLMGDWTGAGGPDVGEIRKRVYQVRKEANSEVGDPTAREPDLRLGGHDGHGNRFLNRAELTKELARLRSDHPNAWNEPHPDESLDQQIDRIYRQAIETGLKRTA